MIKYISTWIKHMSRYEWIKWHSGFSQYSQKHVRCFKQMTLSEKHACAMITWVSNNRQNEWACSSLHQIKHISSVLLSLCEGNPTVIGHIGYSGKRFDAMAPSQCSTWKYISFWDSWTHVCVHQMKKVKFCPSVEFCKPQSKLTSNISYNL